MAGSSKKVILRTLTNAVHAGYLPAGGFVEAGASGPFVPLLDLDGRVVQIALASVRLWRMCETSTAETRPDPERLNRRTFLARPRTEGLWVRLTFVDGDVLEGLAPADLALADGLLEDRGIFFIPPDIRSNTQRLYVPRSALASCELVAVVTTPSKTKPAARPQQQDSLFP